MNRKKKHFCFPVYLVATEASFVSANVTNCAARYGTLLKCPTISLDIVQQTCFTKYRNEGQKTSLIEELWRWEKYMDSLVFRFAKNSFAITQLEYLNVLHQISNHSKGQVWFHIISPAVAYMEQGKALSIWWNPFTTSF